MLRISIGPGEIAGYCANLKSGFDALGIESEHFLLSPSKFGYTEHGHFLDKASKTSLKLRSHRFPPIRLLGFLYAVLIRLAVCIYAAARCNVFIYTGGCSFFEFLELPILKALNKKIIVIFLGSDARPPIFSGRHLDDEGGLVDPHAAFVETRKIRRNIRLIERYADHIINHTATDQFFTREYIRLAHIGLPIRMIEQPPAVAARSAIKIVHAPSRPIAKGTPVFRKAISDLRAEGYDIDFVELIGVSNQKVLEEIASCDFILDELYSDTPMAMFATEAAMLGKPTIVGGHYASDFAHHNADVRHPPTMFVEPAEIKEAIRRLIDDQELRLSLGARAQDFIREHWNSAAVAERFLAIIEGRADSSWTSHPGKTGYLWGWGLSKEAWHRQVRQYVEHNGFDALLLGHNRLLVEKIRKELASV